MSDRGGIPFLLPFLVAFILGWMDPTVRGVWGVCGFGFLLLSETMFLKLNNTGALVEFDDEDAGMVGLFSWREKKVSEALSYAVSQSSVNGIRLSHRMHRLIMSAGDGQIVDHIDGNGLNNRKSNLRICSQKENVRNARRVARRSSGVLNVAALENGHFMGIIVIDGVRIKKTFGSITEAAEWVERLK